MERAVNYLLIDISNSFTKLAFASKTKIRRGQRIRTEGFDAKFLRAFVSRKKIDLVVVCSVVPKKNREVQKAAGKTKVFWLGWLQKIGVGIDYPNPKSIGADRLANAAALSRDCAAPRVKPPRRSRSEKTWNPPGDSGFIRFFSMPAFRHWEPREYSAALRVRMF